MCLVGLKLMLPSLHGMDQLLEAISDQLGTFIHCIMLPLKS